MAALWQYHKEAMRNFGLTALLAATVMVGCSQQDTDKVSADAKSAAQSAGQTISGVALAGKVETALRLRKDIDASTLHVEAKDGVVTITGTVKSLAEKKAVNEVASSTTGVDKVIDTDVKFVTSVPPK